MSDVTSGPQVPPRVLLVDADDRVRESLAGLLGIGRQLTIVGSAGYPEAALALLASEHPDVVVVDPRLPELEGGRAFVSRLRASDPELCIVVMGWSDALEDGELTRQVDACVQKTFRAGELVNAVLTAAGSSAV
jgi:DNA-binding NarL/FixJ family response regulator